MHFAYFHHANSNKETRAMQRAIFFFFFNLSGAFYELSPRGFDAAADARGERKWRCSWVLAPAGLEPILTWHPPPQGPPSPSLCMFMTSARAAAAANLSLRHSCIEHRRRRRHRQSRRDVILWMGEAALQRWKAAATSRRQDALCSFSLKPTNSRVASSCCLMQLATQCDRISLTEK